MATPEKRILYLSETYEGSYSEKRMADEAAFDFRGSVPDAGLIPLLLDLGFPGLHVPGAEVIRPQKKPRGGELTAEQKAENRAKSSIRVVVENALSGVKLWRIVKEEIRSWLHGRRDQVMYLACGLHNFRLGYRLSRIQT